MADWYVSSVAHATIPVFAVSTAYTVGQFVRRITSTVKAQWVMRCTTAGTSAGTEPTWAIGNNATTASGTAVFTNVTGQSAYGWSAAAGDLPTLLGAVGAVRFAGNDRMFVSSDHTETQTAPTTSYGSGNAVNSYNVGQVLSVNRAGSVPPVAADLLAGAAVTVGGTGTLNIDASIPVYHYGISYINTGSFLVPFQISGNGTKGHYFEACQIWLNSTTANARIQGATGVPSVITLSNSTVRFGAVTQGFTIVAGTLFDITWLNTANPLPGSIPNTLFTSVSSVIARGVDFTAVTGTLFAGAITAVAVSRALFDSCKIASGATRFALGAALPTRDMVELINCYDGTNILNESHQASGAVTTERTITLSGGAEDDIGAFSHKMVSSANIDKYNNPLFGFWLDIDQQDVGSSQTATVEIISSASLNNDEISLLLEYQGTAGSSVASIATTLPATVLTTATAVTSSTATWSSSPATPVKQKLEVTFTPRVAGRVRGQVRLGKASTTVYYNPVITIT